MARLTTNSIAKQQSDNQSVLATTLTPISIETIFVSITENNPITTESSIASNDQIPVFSENNLWCI